MLPLRPARFFSLGNSRSEAYWPNAVLNLNSAWLNGRTFRKVNETVPIVLVIKFSVDCYLRDAPRGDYITGVSAGHHRRSSRTFKQNLLELIHDLFTV